MTCAFFHVYFFNFFPLPNFNRACLCFFWFSRSFQAPIINLLKRYKGFISFFIWVRQLSGLLILLTGKQKYNFKLNFTEILILYTLLHRAWKAGVFFHASDDTYVPLPSWTLKLRELGRVKKWFPLTCRNRHPLIKSNDSQE